MSNWGQMLCVQLGKQLIFRSVVKIRLRVHDREVVVGICIQKINESKSM